MIVNAYEYFKKHPGYNKLVGNNFLIIEYNCPVNIEQFQLWTESHFITYVINGRKDWITPDKTFELKAGDALFVRKGVYTTKQYLEEDYCVLLFFVNDEFIKTFITENGLFRKTISPKSNHESIFRLNINDSFQSLIESIFHYLIQTEDIPKSLVEIKFKELLFNISLNTKNRSLLDYFNTINHNTKINIENCMNENFQYDLKIEDFAKLCGRSLSTFKREFKNNFNTSPSRWLMNKRLEHAKTLIRGTELRINEIGFECGFNNSSHFIRTFKEMYGQTPNKFKETQFLK